MQFLYPIGLLALAGAVIPLVIHLWNIKQGKTLKIGSIALLGESSPISSRSYRFTDLLLLVLRLLIILLLAFVLAKPLIEKTVQKKTEKGWVLLKKNQLMPIYQLHKSTIDSLVSKGYSLHDFSPEFKEISLNDTLTYSSIKDTLSVGYFNLLQLLDQQKKAGFKAVLFADQQLSKMGPVKPTLQLELKWIPLQQTDTLKTWISELSTGKYEAVSTPSSTVFTRSAQAAKPIRVMVKAGQHQDAGFIRAAIQAYAKYSKSDIRLSDYRSAELPETDFVFWLSDEKVPEELTNQLKASASYLSYASGKTSPINSSLNLAEQGAASMPGILMSQRINSNLYPGIPVWTDTYGTPLLTRVKAGKQEHYVFYSQFNPDWSDLVWSPAFVRSIIPLIIGPSHPDESAENRQDQRSFVPDFKFRPVNGAAAVSLKADKNPENRQITYTKHIPLEKYLWIILLILVCAERFFSFRKFKNLRNG